MSAYVTQLASLSAKHIDQLVDMYQDEWWTKGRIRSDVAAMLVGSDYVFAYEDSAGRLCAFSRVLTDGVYKAIIFDVIVRRDFRGSKLGARIMGDICKHPALSKIRHIELYCLPELQGFYSQFGFSNEVFGVTLMRRQLGADSA